jgi:hypothetical protein
LTWPHQYLERFLINKQRKKLVPIADEARRQVKQLIEQKYADATVYWYGLERTDPSSLGFTVRTATEGQRMELMRDETYVGKLREILIVLGYPQRAATKVKIHFSSIEGEDSNLDTWGNPRWAYSSK